MWYNQGPRQVGWACGGVQVKVGRAAQRNGCCIQQLAQAKGSAALQTWAGWAEGRSSGGWRKPVGYVGRGVGAACVGQWAGVRGSAATAAAV